MPKIRTHSAWTIATGVLTLFTALWSTHLFAVELTATQQTARERGITLFNQFRVGGSYLRIAAEAGDADAQFYLGEEIRTLNRFITRESQKWLEAAANQGHIYAMIRLGRSGNDLCAVMGNCPSGSRSPRDWLRHAYSAVLPLAEQADPEAMFLMYEITSNSNWLDKAAEAGHALAQYRKAVFILEGTGFNIFINWKQDAEKWFKASAEGGYPKGMERYISILAERGDWQGVRYWHQRVAETGYAEGIFELALHLLHEPERYEYQLDLVKGYGLLSLLLELDGGGNLKRFAENLQPQIAVKMTPEQIERALEFAEEWKATHPPVSYFPDKLSIY